MTNAVIVITHLWNADFRHWWEAYFFGGHGVVWYLRLVWGNVFADIVFFTGAALGYVWHQGVLKEAREETNRRIAKHQDIHTEHLKKILDALDPATDGGLADIKDALDPTTPSGIGVILKELQAARDTEDAPRA
jgi:hypothetical protein